MNIIEIKNLTHIFPDRRVGLDSFNLEVKKGELLIIAGQNGCGKTTFLKHLNGLLLPCSGTLKIDGKSVTKNIKWARQFVGMVFQDSDSQIVCQTVRDDVAFGPENLCLDYETIANLVSEAMEAAGISDMADFSPHTLSGGEKRKLAIAGILAMKPEIIVLDEPFACLDYPGVRQILSQIVNLHKTGRTIIVTTHDIEKIAAHADRIAFMQKGKIALEGPPSATVCEAEKFGVRVPCPVKSGFELQSWLK